MMLKVKYWILLHDNCHAGAIFLFGINMKAEVRDLATRWCESPTKQLRCAALNFNWERKTKLCCLHNLCFYSSFQISLCVFHANTVSQLNYCLNLDEQFG